MPLPVVVPVALGEEVVVHGIRFPAQERRERQQAHAAFGQHDRLVGKLEQDIDPDELVGQLRLGKQQIVEIAKALSFNARILIMDEPTAAISKKETETLFQLIHEIKTKGSAVLVTPIKASIPPTRCTTVDPA